MKIKRKVFAMAAAGSLLLLAILTLFFLHLARASNEEVPAFVNPCLPQPIHTSKLWGTVAVEDARYYLVGVFAQPPGSAPAEVGYDIEPAGYQESLIYVDAQEQCRALAPDLSADPVLSHYLPVNLARELALQSVTRSMQEAGGRDAYQQQLVEHLQQSALDPSMPAEFAAEYVWAFEQLGIQLPPGSYKLLR